MAPIETKELVLAQGQYAFIQDETKGLVKVHVGPTTITPSGNDQPVTYNSQTRSFEASELDDALQQNPTAPEGSYIVLENPAKDAKHPENGQSGLLPDLEIGRKISIQGPTTFALWPGQVATVIEGHQLKSNEYVRARVYNVDEAKKNWSVDSGLPSLPTDLAVGQIIIIQGTDVNFFIPPTGVEALRDNGKYVCQAITLERLEYCILLDEDGNKRYEKGPQVVFPKATEKFITKKADSATAQAEAVGQPSRLTVFKMTELNDQMGIYVKVIADYEEEVPAGHVIPLGEPGTLRHDSKEDQVLVPGQRPAPGKTFVQYKTGDELFITGKTQRIYFPRPEHALIEYGEDGAFKRQRYYGIAIPKGEARYVLNKDTGEVSMKRGPQVFLPDPRHEVVVRRILDAKTIGLWYPQNAEALAYNQTLAAVSNSSSESGGGYVADTSFNAVMDTVRSLNRSTSGSRGLTGSASLVGETMQRGTKYTPPPSLTLNTKYDGPPMVSPWTGYAVQIVGKDGTRRVVKGPTTVLLEYDQSLEKLILSTGNPKTTDTLIEDVYLRVDHNKVSDTITAETKDMVLVSIKVSYRVNFEGEPEKWFNVENYVKFMTDHCRSLLRAKIKHLSIKELIDNSSEIVRDVVLGDKVEGGTRSGRKFDENGMRIYDVEVLGTTIQDSNVAALIANSQKAAVKNTLELTAKQQELMDQQELSKIETGLAELHATAALKKIELEDSVSEAQHKSLVTGLEAEAARNKLRTETATEIIRLEAEGHTVHLIQEEAKNKVDLDRMDKETENFKTRMAALNDKLATAIDRASQDGSLQKISEAVIPIALMEQQGLAPIVRRLFQGTSLAGKIEEVLTGKNGDNGSK